MMGEPLAAMRFRFCGSFASAVVGGTMLTLAPVSMRKWVPEMVSKMCMRYDALPAERLFIELFVLDRPDRFPVVCENRRVFGSS